MYYIYIYIYIILIEETLRPGNFAARGHFTLQTIHPLYFPMLTMLLLESDSKLYNSSRYMRRGFAPYTLITFSNSGLRLRRLQVTS